MKTERSPFRLSADAEFDGGASAQRGHTQIGPANGQNGAHSSKQ